VKRDELFREVTLRITSSLEIAEALKATFDYLLPLIPMDGMGLYYFDSEQMGVYAVAEVHRDEGVRTFDESTPLSKVDETFRIRLEQKLTESGIVEIYNRPEDKDLDLKLKCLEYLDDCSQIALQLLINQEFLGALIIYAEGDDRFTQEHAAIIEHVKDPIALAMSNARRYGETVRLKNMLVDDNRAMYREIERLSGNQVIGAEFGLKHIMDAVRQVAPTNSPVFLSGETGTGKEVIANAIHMISPRREGPMIRVQCGAIPDTLLDSELFGHEKGAFTGAIQMKRGRFERAHEGTIFLDEIGELSLDAQVKLLRVLQEKELERVGGTQTISVDVRVIAATNRRLEEMVQQGTFREDLWYRLNVFPIHIPPLRQRREDIPSLIQYFIERKSREMNLKKLPVMRPEYVDRVMNYDWPGNVRELQNVVERALILQSHDKPIMADLVPRMNEATTEQEQTSPAITDLDDIVRQHITSVMQQTHGRIQGPGGAAELLGLNPSTLRARLRKLSIPFGRRPEVG